MTKIRKVYVVLVSALVAAAVSAVTVQGCGGSSSSDDVALCNQGCDKTATCFGGDAATCKQGCSTRAGTVTGCSNAAAIRSAYRACVAGTCDAFVACAASIPDCQGGSTTGTGGSSGGGTGGSSGGTGCSVCDKAGACCVALATAAGQPTTSCAGLSAAACNAQTGTTQTQLISSCTQVVTAGAGSGIAACR